MNVVVSATTVAVTYCISDVPVNAAVVAEDGAARAGWERRIDDCINRVAHHHVVRHRVNTRCQLGTVLLTENRRLQIFQRNQILGV